MILPEYGEHLVRIRKKELAQNVDLTSPEATSLAAIEALNIVALRVANGKIEAPGVDSTIGRHADLVYQSPARERAIKKIFPDL